MTTPSQQCADKRDKPSRLGLLEIKAAEFITAQLNSKTKGKKMLNNVGKKIKLMCGAAVMVGLLSTMSACDGSQSNTDAGQSAAAVEAGSFTLPDYTGKTLDVAVAELKAKDIKVESVDIVDGKTVLSPKNWEIEGHKPAAGVVVKKGSTVTFNVSKPGAAEAKAKAAAQATADAVASAKVSADAAKVAASEAAQASQMATAPAKTSLGLEANAAQTACTLYAKSQFPYGVKMHWILGRLAEEIKDDQWFLKVESDVTNAYGVKAKGANIECYVSGTNEVPLVTEFNAY